MLMSWIEVCGLKTQKEEWFSHFNSRRLTVELYTNYTCIFTKMELDRWRCTYQNIIEQKELSLFESFATHFVQWSLSDEDPPWSQEECPSSKLVLDLSDFLNVKVRLGQGSFRLWTHTKLYFNDLTGKLASSNLLDYSIWPELIS